MIRLAIAWLAERWVALDLDLADLHFYGGLALAAWGGWHVSPYWTAVAVGAALMLSNLGPVLAALANRKG